MNKSFFELIDEWKTATGATTNKELAKLLEIPYPTFATWIKRQSIPQFSLIRLQKKLPPLMQNRLLLDQDPSKKNKISSITEALHQVSLSYSLSIIASVVNAASIVDTLYSMMHEIDLPSSEYIEHNGIYSETYFNFFDPIAKYIMQYVSDNRNLLDQTNFNHKVFHTFFIRDEFTETLSKMLYYHDDIDPKGASKSRVYKILKKLDEIPDSSAKYWILEKSSDKTIEFYWNLINQQLIDKENDHNMKEYEESLNLVNTNNKADSKEHELSESISNMLLEIISLDKISTEEEK
jgi:hypothetical protein